MFNTWGPKKIERGQKQKTPISIFFETDTNTFIDTKCFRTQYRYHQKNWKVLKPRSFETEMTMEAYDDINSFCRWNWENMWFSRQCSCLGSSNRFSTKCMGALMESRLSGWWQSHLAETGSLSSALWMWSSSPWSSYCGRTTHQAKQDKRRTTDDQYYLHSNAVLPVTS